MSTKRINPKHGIITVVIFASISSVVGVFVNLPPDETEKPPAWLPVPVADHPISGTVTGDTVTIDNLSEATISIETTETFDIMISDVMLTCTNGTCRDQYGNEWKQVEEPDK